MEAFNMKDDRFSQYVRKVRGLDPNWRVYLWEAVGTDENPKVRLTGAIARPASRYDHGRKEGDPVWIKPFVGKSQITLTQAQYKEIAESLKESA